VVGTPSHSLFLLGILVLAAYVPLYLWRRVTDRRRAESEAQAAPPEMAVESGMA
jgi:hypothetical protein